MSYYLWDFLKINYQLRKYENSSSLQIQEQWKKYN
jgi:hypothetical protein